MTTRHISEQTDYPFVPELTPTQRAIVAGITDVYFIIQGAPSGSESSDASPVGSSSNSSSGEAPLPFTTQTIRLISYATISNYTEFIFRAQKDVDTWNISFLVPNSNQGTLLGQVYNTDPGNCQAVLIYNSGLIVNSGSGGVNILVEPARAQWHTERVAAISFYNIKRVNGMEDSSVLLLAMTKPGNTGSSSSVGETTLSWANGYNCVVGFDELGLYLQGQLGTGDGIAVDFGDTVEDSSSVAEIRPLLCINGVTPAKGNLPIEVSNSAGLISIAAGYLTVVGRRTTV